MLKLKSSAFTASTRSEYNDQYTAYGAKMSHAFSEYVPWPTGPKLKKFIDGANEQLESMKELLEGEVPVATSNYKFKLQVKVILHLAGYCMYKILTAVLCQRPCLNCFRVLIQLWLET